MLPPALIAPKSLTSKVVRFAGSVEQAMAAETNDPRRRRRR